MIRRWNFAVVAVMCIGFAVAAVFDIAGLAQLGRQFGGYGSETGQFLAGGVAVLFVLLAGLNLRLWWGLRSTDSRISANPQKPTW